MFTHIIFSCLCYRCIMSSFFMLLLLCLIIVLKNNALNILADSFRFMANPNPEQTKYFSMMAQIMEAQNKRDNKETNKAEQKRWQRDKQGGVHPHPEADRLINRGAEQRQLRRGAETALPECVPLPGQWPPTKPRLTSSPAPRLAMSQDEIRRRRQVQLNYPHTTSFKPFAFEL